MDIHTDRQKQTDRQARQTDELTDKLADIYSYKQTDIHTYIQIDKQTDIYKE